MLMSEGRLKSKKIDYKQFKLFDETDKKLKRDGETKNFIIRLKIKKKALIKRDLRNILATNLLQNKSKLKIF